MNLHIDSKNSGRYSFATAAKSAVGRCNPELINEHHRALAVFLCAKHCHIRIMVGRAGQPSGWPVSLVAGIATPVRLTTHKRCNFGGGYLIPTNEVAIMATIPALATPEIIITNGQAVTTSLAVSEYFTKQHHHVVQKIESLECSDEFLTRNFSRVQFEHRGNNYQAYEITRDGFAFLAMGFTGKKAATFKENYITAFNAMEATLNGHQPSLPECSQILLTLQNGKVIDSRAVRKNEVIASLGTFIEMAERGGYLVIHTDDLKSLSFGRKPRSDE